jgi:CheY-like chemotaxis protein
MKPAPAVLLAEDNEDDLFLSRRMLAKAGLETVHHVADGRQALDYLAGRGPYADRARHPLPDIVLLDLKMPGHTGHEVLEWLRRQPDLQAVRVYVLTSSDEPSDRRRVQKAGAQGYIVKPLLLEHVSAILAVCAPSPALLPVGVDHGVARF